MHTQTHTYSHTHIYSYMHSYTHSHTQSHRHTNLLNLISIKISVYWEWGDLSIADSGANMIVIHDFHIT